MSFDEFPYRKIPIWENLHRFEFLVRYRDLLSEFFRRLERESTESDGMVELRGRIEQYTPTASDLIRLADISLIVSVPQRDLISTRVKWLKIGENFDLLDNFSWLEIPGLRKEAIGRVNRAIGRYEQNKSKAWENTCNPFFWIALIADLFVQLIAWIAQLPVRVYSLVFRVDEEEAARSRVGRIVTGISVLLQGLAALVFLFDRFGLMRWLGLK